MRAGTAFAPVPLGEEVDREKLLAGEYPSWDVAESSGGGAKSAGSSRNGGDAPPTSAGGGDNVSSSSPPSLPPPPTISNRPNMPFIVSTATEIAAAMAYLHSLDVLHGDLTGGNVLLSSVSGGSAGSGGASAAAVGAATPQVPTPSTDLRGWTAKVADLGLARVLSCDAISTGTYGTVTHCPPELLTEGRLSRAADVYAFGVLCWETYTGRRPWEGMMQMQVIFHVTVRKRRLTFPPGRPHPKFMALAEACMAPDAADRPSFDAVLEALAGVEGA